MAIDRSLQRKYERTYRKWKRAHDRFWKKYGNEPYIEGGRPQSLTFGEQSMQSLQDYRMRSNANVLRPPTAAQFKTNQQAERAIAAMERELSPSYARRRNKQMRNAITKAIDAHINDEGLSRKVRLLTDDQLSALIERSDFLDSLMFLAYPPTETSEPYYDPSFLEDTVDYYVATMPNKAQQRKLTRLEKAQAKWEKQREERERRNRELAKKGVEWLKRYGVGETGEGADWWRKYVKG